MSDCATFSDVFPGFVQTSKISAIGASKAPWPVWKNSTTKNPKTAPLTRGEARQIVNHLKRYLRHTLTLTRAARRECLILIDVMLFEFHNFKTGRLDPSYETLADRANMSRATVARYLRLLKAWGVINWVRRRWNGYEDGRYTCKQESNSYAVLPPSQWKDYKAPPPPPRPERDEMGLEPVIIASYGLDAGCEAIRAGAHGMALATALKSDPHDETALMLARMTERQASEWKAHMDAERARKVESGPSSALPPSGAAELKAALARRMGLAWGAKS
jgi:hypothetical protein